MIERISKEEVVICKPPEKAFADLFEKLSSKINELVDAHNENLIRVAKSTCGNCPAFCVCRVNYNDEMCQLFRKEIDGCYVFNKKRKISYFIEETIPKGTGAYEIIGKVGSVASPSYPFNVNRDDISGVVLRIKDWFKREGITHD